MEYLVLDLKEVHRSSAYILDGTLDIPQKDQAKVFESLNEKLKKLIVLVTSVIPLHPDHFFDIENQDPNIEVTFENFRQVFYSSVLQKNLSYAKMFQGSEKVTVKSITKICQEISDMYDELLKIYEYVG